MKTIEEIKNELTIKYLNGTLEPYLDIKDLPKNDELREFICKLGPNYTYCYAFYVDKGPHDLTRKACCKDLEYTYYYALNVDREYLEETFKVVRNDPEYSVKYIKDVKGAAFVIFTQFLDMQEQANQLSKKVEELSSLLVKERGQ